MLLLLWLVTSGNWLDGSEFVGALVGAQSWEEVTRREDPMGSWARQQKCNFTTRPYDEEESPPPLSGGDEVRISSSIGAVVAVVVVVCGWLILVG